MNTTSLDRHRINRLFLEMGHKMSELGQTAEIAVYGGSAIAVLFDFRQSTQDVDYMPISGDIETLKSIAAELCIKESLPPNWFNNAIQIFVSEQEKLSLLGEYGNPTGLRVFTATPHYLLAMKCLSMRNSMVSSDNQDVWHLIDECGYTKPQEAFDLVASFYPERKLPRKHQLLITDLFESKLKGQAYNPAMGY